MKIKVKTNELVKLEEDLLNKGEYNVHNLEFEFVEEYDGLVKKIALVNGENSGVYIIENDKFTIPRKFLQEEGLLTIKVFGEKTKENAEGEVVYDTIYSPFPMYLKIVDGSYTEGLDDLTDEELSEIEQMEQNINELNKLIEEQVLPEFKKMDEEVIPKLNTIEENAQVNKIEVIKVNGETLEILDSKTIEINIPTKLSQFENDSKFVNEDQLKSVSDKIDADENKMADIENDISAFKLEQTSQNTKIEKNKLDIETLNTDIQSNKETIKNVQNDLKNYYTKSESYSKNEVNDLVSKIPKFAILVVDELPTTNISETTIYLVPSVVEENDIFQEWLYVNGIRWEKLGTQKIDLSNYYNKQEVDNLLANKADKTDLDDYVDKNSYNLKTNEIEANKLDKTAFTEYKTSVDKNISDLENNKANSSNVYKKEETYSKEESDNLVKDFIKFDVTYTLEDDKKLYDSKDGLINEDSIYCKNKTLTDTFSDFIDVLNNDSHLEIDGYTEQEIIEGEEGTEIVDTSLKIDDADTTKENYILLEGNSYQKTTTGKQLLDLVDGTYTNNGITAVVESGKVTLNGTATSNTSFLLGSANIISADYGNYTLSNNILSGSYTGQIRRNLKNAAGTQNLMDDLIDNIITDNIQEDTGDSYVWIASGTSISNFSFNTQLEKGTEATDCEEYTGGISSPNPEYPQNIEVVTGYNKFSFRGKNHFDINAVESNKGLSGTTGQTATSNNRDTSDYIEIEENTQYIISNIITTAICFYDSSKTFISGGSTNPFTTPANSKYVRFGINKETQPDYSQGQFEEGPTATEYEPYQGNTYSINLGSLELCKIGDYQDYIYKSNNKWYKHKEIGKVVLDGSETWSTTLKRPTTIRFNANANITPAVNYIGNSNYFNVRSEGSNNIVCLSFYANSPIVYIWIQQSIANDVETFKTWLSSHNVTLYYPLVTPVEEEITEESLISQLDALHKAKLNNGTTYIETESGNGVLPYINLKYNVLIPKPSPERPSEIKVLTGNKKVCIHGKNYFDKYNTIWVKNNNDVYTDTVNTSTTRIRSQNLIKLQEGITYTISGIPIGISVGSIKFYSNTSTTTVSSRVTTATFTVPYDAPYVVLQFNGENFTSETNKLMANANIQIEEGTEASNYEEFICEKFNLPLGNLEFCEINDFKDLIHKVGSKWYKNKVIEKVVLDGSENWNKSDSTGNFGYNIPILSKVQPHISLTTPAYISHFQNVAWSDVSLTNYNATVTRIAAWNYTAVRMRDDRFSTVEEFKQWLSANNVIIYFILEDLVEEEITDTNLVSQLDAINDFLVDYKLNKELKLGYNSPTITIEEEN